MRKADLRHNHEKLDAAISRYRAFLERIIAAQEMKGHIPHC